VDMRKMMAALLLTSLGPAVAEAQTTGRFSVQAGGGPTLRDSGNVVAAAIGFAPASRVEILFNVERDHLPTRVEQFDNVTSVTRGGTLTYASGELRVSFLPPDRVSPFVLAGAGAGRSRLNVNEHFPSPVENDLQVLYFGGGVRVPLGDRVSLFGDVRIVAGAEGGDGLIALYPVRAGLLWRF
jgi:hypothetical protein